MNVFIVSYTKEIQSQFGELSISAKTVTIENLLKTNEPLDLVIIHEHDYKIMQYVKAIRQKYINSFIVHIYSDSSLISGTLSSGANDIFNGSFLQKNILSSRIKTWIDAVRYRELANSSSIKGKNVLGAHVWPIKTAIAIENQQTCELLREYLGDKKSLSNEHNSSKAWIDACVDLGLGLLSQKTDDNHPILIFEENSDFRFVTVSGICIKDKEHYMSVIDLIGVQASNLISSSFKHSRNTFSLYVQKLQEIRHINQGNMQIENICKTENELNSIVRHSVADMHDSASEYVKNANITENDIYEFVSIEQEIAGLLRESSGVSEQLILFAGFFEAYAKAIEKLPNFEHLKVGIEEAARIVLDLSMHTDETQEQALTFANLIMLDLKLWRTHLFELQDVENIHYLDAALLANCMQFDALLNPDKTQGAGEIELF